MFSKSCEYGIRATIFIVSEYFKENRPGIKEIAKEIDSPEAFTAKILQTLVKHKIISSNKGPSGGFSITEESLASTKLADIVSAIDGDSVYQRCGLGLLTCSEKTPCPAHHKFKHIRNQLKEMLTSVSIKDMATGVMKGTAFLKREK